MFSSRASLDLGENPLARALSARAAEGRSNLDLTVSNPTRARLPYERALVASAFAADAALDYAPEPFGLFEARARAAELFRARGASIDAARVVLTASTSEAYSFLFKLLADPSDEVLVPRPSYPLFEHLARFEGVNAVPYPLAYDGAWHVDLPLLRKAVTPRTRAVVVVTPNNPTGSFLKRPELRALAALGLPIVSDEVFGDYALGPGEARAGTALELEDGLVFALDGLSKRAGLPQAKLAWIGVGGAAPSVREALARLEVIADAFLSPGAAVQHALPSLLELSSTTRVAILERIRRNHAFVGGAVAASPATLLTVEGGWYAVLRLPNTRTEESWVLGLLEATDVLVQPGFFYDFADEPYAVLSLLTPEEEFAAGVRALVGYVAVNA